MKEGEFTHLQMEKRLKANSMKENQQDLHVVSLIALELNTPVECNWESVKVKVTKNVEC